ncbi:MAG: protoporphyrinogen oxidase [Pseudomonadota bacterium]
MALMLDTIIVGGGVAGLTAAWDLDRAGHKVLVLEAASEIGGNVRTMERDDFRMERGPHSFLSSADHVWRLVEELGLDHQVEEAAPVASNRYILRGGRLHALPLSAGAFLGTRLLSFGAKARLTMEPFIRPGGTADDTAWEFFVRRFGEEAAAWIMSPFISGIYAGDIHALGARAAFPKFWGFEQESGSMIRGAMRYMKEKKRRLVAEGKAPRKGLFTIYRGIGGLTTTLGVRLSQKILADIPVQTITQGDGCVRVSWAGGEAKARSVVVAAPPPRASAMLAEVAPGAADALDEIPLVQVAVIHWSPIQEDVGPWPAGFGALIPRQEGLRVLGTLFPSQLFEGRAPAGRRLFTSYYGGALDPDAATLPDEGLLAVVREEHTTMFGFDPGPLDRIEVLRYEHAIPQLLPGHPEVVSRLRTAAGRVPGLFLAGNYLTGVGIENAVESGYQAAGEVKHWLEATS